METTSTGKQRIDTLSQSAHQAVDRASSAASQMAQRFGEKGEELLALQENWVEGAREYVREHPIAALGIAVAAGYLLHLITRSR
ncbi:MAG: DUF883 domain-containing protein [Pseudomonadota bacterium]|nr:DUF883 domain-containing protein [Pseudomonadota bacterium]